MRGRGGKLHPPFPQLGIKGEARRAAPHLPPGGRVCDRDQQNFGVRG